MAEGVASFLRGFFAVTGLMGFFDEGRCLECVFAGIAILGVDFGVFLCLDFFSAGDARGMPFLFGLDRFRFLVFGISGQFFP